MGEHLSFEEKSRAFDEYCENSKQIKCLKKKIVCLRCKEENKNEVNKLKNAIYVIRLRQERLTNFLSNSKKSKYGGMYGENGLCYKMFGKKAKYLTKEERRLYNKIKQQEHRSKTKTKKEET